MARVKRNAYKEKGHQHLMELRNDAAQARRVFERDWYMNIAYIQGESDVGWAQYSPDEGRLIEVPNDGAYQTINMMRKIARIERAKLMKVVPTPEALPVTHDLDDTMTAQALTAYFDDLRDKWDFERRLRTGTFWLIATGNVFFKWYWDDVQGQPNVVVVSPFDIYPDPYVKNFYDSRWVIHSQFISEETAEERYKDYPGSRMEHLKGAQTEPTDSLESRLLANYGSETRPLTGVTIHEYHEPPSRMCPEGRWVVYTDGGIVIDRSYPYNHGKLPFTHAGHIERGHTKWYASVMDDMRPLQTELNEAERRVVENAALSQGKWFVHTSMELKNPISSDVGEVVNFGGDPNLPPTLVTNSSLPDWVKEEPNRLMGIMSDLAVQHEVSNAGVPGEVSAGSAIQLLQETDDSVMKDTIHSLEECIQKGFMMVAHLFKQWGNTTEMVNVYDKDAFLMVHELRKDSIPADLRVRVKTTTGLPQSQAGKFDRVLQLWQYGVLTDPQQVLELLELAPQRGELDQTLDDKREAHQENIQISKLGVHDQDKVPLPQRFENHEVHRKTHDQYRKTAEYKRLPQHVMEYFEYHDQLHRKMEISVLEEEAKKQMLLQAAMGGGEAPPSDGGSGMPNDGGPPPPPEADSAGPGPVAG